MFLIGLISFSWIKNNVTGKNITKNNTNNLTVITIIVSIIS